MKRSVNLFLIFVSYLLSRLTRKVIQWGQPAAVTIEPTNRCNLNCPECPSGQDILTREKGMLTPETFDLILSSLKESLFYITFYFQGEPYLHPRFTELVAKAKALKLFVSTSTNGHFLSPENAKKTVESGLDKLIVSLDGTDQPGYESYRIGGSFEKVTEGIREIARQKKAAGSKHPQVAVQFLVLKTNEHRIGEVKRVAKELGADKVEIKSAQFYDFENGNPLMPENPTYCRYEPLKQQDGQTRYRIKNTLPNHCLRMWSSCVITWDGWVVPCCYDKDATYRMGNIHRESFRDIWRSQKYNEFRLSILRNRKNNDICRNCLEGTGITRFL